MSPVYRTPLAEAYYLLGVAESFISRTLWMSETEFFLETAIRLAPKSVSARQAYAFLEEYVLIRYTVPRVSACRQTYRRASRTSPAPEWLLSAAAREDG